jgi:hypothetical protein
MYVDAPTVLVATSDFAVGMRVPADHEPPAGSEGVASMHEVPASRVTRTGRSVPLPNAPTLDW